jgi:hypothetical protein
LLAGLTAGKVYGLWAVRKAVVFQNGSITQAVAEAAARVGLDRPVEVRESGRFKVPSVVGILRPRLLLPQQARHWPQARLKAILHHELAHVRRNDILAQLLAQIACCFYWFNPLIWILERRLFIERERACDDVALRQKIKASDYAGHLMEVLEEMGDMKKTTWVTAAMAEGTDFRDRILSVLNPVVPRTAPRRVQALAVVLLAVLLILPLSAMSPWHTASAARSGPFFADSDPMFRSGRDTTVQAPVRRDREDRQEEKTARPERADRSRDEDPREERDRFDRGTRGISFAFLLEMLQSPVAKIREYAATDLGQRGDPRAVPALLDALDDEDAGVREHVATALGHLEDERAVEPLCDVLLNDRQAVVREHAASALGNIGDERAVKALKKAITSDPDHSVQEHAASALRKIL